LAEHIAHLFIRDPISLFEEKLELNDEEEIDHFEVSVSMSPIVLITRLSLSRSCSCYIYIDLNFKVCSIFSLCNQIANLKH